MYHRIVLLIDGFTDLRSTKSALGVLRYRPDDVIAVVDRTHAGKTAQDLLGLGGNTPVVATVQEALAQGKADSLFLGLAPAGGGLPEAWRTIITEAIAAGLDIVSGLHVFLTDDPAFATLAEEKKVTLRDLRKTGFREAATRQGIREDCYRIHTVGTDCNLGKMITSLELTESLQARGRDAQFVATGQTGMMIADNGIAIDAVVADFINGAAEQLIRDHQKHEILLFEGQGSLTQPLFSSVTLGLLHGCLPDALILCHEPGRTHYRHTDVPLAPLPTFVELYERMAGINHPCRIVGVALNSSGLSADEYTRERDRLRRELALPVADVIREGRDNVLVDAVLAHGRAIGKLPLA